MNEWRHPDEILADIDLAQGFLDDQALEHGHQQSGFQLRGLVWEIIEDVRSSYRLAMESCGVGGLGVQPETVDEVQDTVRDYLTNHYGDD